MHEIDHLDLVELVHAQHAARHLARAARLAAEARRIGRQLDRKLLSVQNVVAVVVRDRDLRRRDEPEVVHVAVVQVFGELRQLARARHGRRIHDERRQHFRIPLLLAVQVEHVLDERALQLGALSQDDREARARQLDAAREVENAQFLADFHVVQNREVAVLPFAHEPHDLVRRAVQPRRDLRRGDVGDHEERFAQIVLDRGQFAVDFGDAVAHGAHLGLGRGNVAAGGGDFADFLRRGVALGLQRLGLAQKRAAFRVQIARLLEPCTLHAAAGERLRGGFKIVSQLLDIDHFSNSLLVPSLIISYFAPFSADFPRSAAPARAPSRWKAPFSSRRRR